MQNPLYVTTLEMNDALYKVRDTSELASVIVAKRHTDPELPYLARSVAKTYKEYVLEVCGYTLNMNFM